MEIEGLGSEAAPSPGQTQRGAWCHPRLCCLWNCSVRGVSIGDPASNASNGCSVSLFSCGTPLQLPSLAQLSWEGPGDGRERMALVMPSGRFLRAPEERLEPFSIHGEPGVGFYPGFELSLDVPCSSLGVPCLFLGVPCHCSDVPHLFLDVTHLLGVPQHSLDVPCSPLGIPYSSLGVSHPSVDVPCPSLGVPCPSFGVPHPSLDITHLLGVPCLLWVSCVLPWVSHVPPWMSHIPPWVSHVIAWMSHISS